MSLQIKPLNEARSLDDIVNLFLSELRITLAQKRFSYSAIGAYSTAVIDDRTITRCSIEGCMFKHKCNGDNGFYGVLIAQFDEAGELESAAYQGLYPGYVNGPNGILLAINRISNANDSSKTSNANIPFKYLRYDSVNEIPFLGIRQEQEKPAKPGVAFAFLPSFENGHCH